MNEYLLIHYTRRTDDVFFWALGGGNHPSITLGRGSLSELSSMAQGKRVYLLIDTRMISLESLHVPSRNRARQLQAVPYAMEEMLACDIEEMHFAPGKAGEGDALPVIAIEKKRLNELLDNLASEQIHPHIITADCLALPYVKDQWSILAYEDSILIRTGTDMGYACDRQIFPGILEALLQKNELADLSINLIHCKDDSHAETLFADTQLPIKQHFFQAHPLEIFSQHFNPLTSLNLLQGAFTPQRSSTTGWLRPWRMVAGIAAIWIALDLTASYIQASQLNQRNIELSKQIESEFKRAMPEARSMSNMRKRVERKLRDLKQQSSNESSSDFLNILNQGADSLTSGNKVKIVAIAYRGTHIDFEMTATSLQDIEQLKLKLDKIAGLNSVLSTTVEKNTVKGRLRLEARG